MAKTTSPGAPAEMPKPDQSPEIPPNGPKPTPIPPSPEPELVPGTDPPDPTPGEAPGTPDPGTVRAENADNQFEKWRGNPTYRKNMGNGANIPGNPNEESGGEKDT